MKRMRNSVKAIIVSICLIVVLAGSIVGVVLATRKKADNPNSNNGGGGGGGVSPVPGLTYELTEEQKQLASSIEKLTLGVSRVAKEYVVDDYVYENGSKIDMTKVSLIRDNYIVIDVSGNDKYYLKVVRQDKSVYYFNPLESIENTYNVVASELLEIAGNFVTYKVLYEDTGKFNLMLAILDVTDVANIEIAKSYEILDIGTDYEDTVLYSESTIEIEGNLAYFSIVDKVTSLTLDVNVVNLNTLQVEKTYTIETLSEDNHLIDDDKFFFLEDDEYNFGFYSNGSLKTYTYKFENYSDVWFGSSIVFVEFAQIIENSSQKTELTVEGMNYSYSIIDLKTGVVSEFKLDDGFAKASFHPYIDEYYGIFIEKFENDVSVEGKTIYFDLNGNRIVEYKSKTVCEIVNVDGSNILSQSGILSTKNSIQAETLVEFGSESFPYELYNVLNLKVSKTFIVRHTDKNVYKIMNTSGNFVYSDDFVDAVAYDDGYYFVRNTNSQTFIINSKTNTKTLVENVIPENYFILNNGGYFIVDNQDGSYSLKNFKNEVIFDDIISVPVYENKFDNHTHMTVQLSTGIKHTYYLDRYINVGSGARPYGMFDEVSESDDSDVELYDDKYGSFDYGAHDIGSWGVKFEGALGGDGNECRISLKSPKGQYLRKSIFTVDRNASTNSILLGAKHASTSYARDECDCEMTAVFGHQSCPKEIIIDYGPSSSYDDAWDNDYGKCKNVTIDSEFVTDHYEYEIYVTAKDGNDLDALVYKVNNVKMCDISGSTVKGTVDFNDSYVSDRKYTYDEDIDISTPSRTGYTFVGFFLNSDLTDPADEYTDNVDDDGNAIAGTYNFHDDNHCQIDYVQNFFVKWKPNTYEVSLYMGSYSDSYRNWPAGNGNVTLPAPTAAVGNMANFAADSAAGTISFTATYGYTYTICKDGSGNYVPPKKEGYTFTGWSGSDDTDGVLTIENKTSDVEYTAEWTGNKYQLNFILGRADNDDSTSILRRDYFKDESSQTLPDSTQDVNSGKWLLNSTDNNENKTGLTTTTNTLPNTYFSGKFNNGYSSYDASRDSSSKLVSYTNSTWTDWFEFTYDGATYNQLSNAFYTGWTDIEYKVKLDPREIKEFGFSTYNIGFQICGWAYGVNESNADLATFDNYKLLTNQSDYVTQILRNEGKSLYDGENVVKLDLYAVYEPKPYHVYFENDVDNTGDSLVHDYETLHNINSNSSTNVNDIIRYSFEAEARKEETIEVHTDNLYSGKSFDYAEFRMGDQVNITITLGNSNTSDAGDNRHFYMFDRIELNNFGYKSGYNSYAYAKIIFTRSRDGVWSISAYKTGETKNLYNTDYNTIVSATWSAPSGADKLTEDDLYKDGDWWYLDDDQEQVNAIGIIEKNLTSDDGYKDNPYVIIRIRNVNYAGDELIVTDNNRTISSDSVTGRGKFGFGIKTFVRSNYSENDKIEDYKLEKNCDCDEASCDGATTENLGLTQTNITTLHQTNAAIYNGTTSLEKGVFFWLNGSRHVLCDSSGNFYKLSSAKSGYYTIKSRSNLTLDNLLKTNAGNYYTIGEGGDKFIAFRAEYDTSGSLGETSVYVDMGNEKVYYLGGDYPWAGTLSDFDESNNGGNNNLTNYNNTQLLVVTPSQKIVNVSSGPNATEASSSSGGDARYELINYISKIDFGDKSSNTKYLEFSYVTKKIVEEYPRKYEKYDFKMSGGETYEASGIPTSIPYLGELYDVLFTYKFTSTYQANPELKRDFIIYIATRRVEKEIAGGGKVTTTDNFIRYFIYTNVGYGAAPDEMAYNFATNITVTFSTIKNDIIVNVTDSENLVENASGKTTASGITGASTVTVEYHYDKMDGSSISLNSDIDSTDSLLDKYSVNYTSDPNPTISYNLGVTPRDLRVVKISPKDGFIIQQVTIKMVNSNLSTNLTIFSSSLHSTTMKSMTSGTDTYMSFVSTEGSESTSWDYNFKYSLLTNSYFYGHKYNKNNLDYISGIAYSNIKASTWNMPSSNNTSTKEAFESVYILIGGVYEDVQIDVKTASYIEFDFNAENAYDLGYDDNAVVRYNPEPKGSSGSEWIKYTASASGGVLLNLKPLPTDWPIYKQNGYGNYTKVTNPTNTNGSYWVKESEGSDTYYRLMLAKDSDSNGAFEEVVQNASGRYYLDGTKNVDDYTYLDKYNETSPNGKFLAELTRLSILINIGTAASPNYVKLGEDMFAPYNSNPALNEFYDASFVCLQENTPGRRYRVVFIGKSKYFENGVKIFASGEDYSSYFTQGYMYNDDGNDAAGKDTGKHMLQLLSDVEGRKVNTANNSDGYYLALNKTLTNGFTDKIDKTDCLTYMQINSLVDFFKNTLTNRSDNNDNTNTNPNYEFARKYVFSVNVYTNTVSMNVNSYISNDVYTQDKSSPKTNYVSASHTNTNTTITLQTDTAKNVNKNNKWPLTVTNFLNNTPAYSLMWLNNNNENVAYQLDYVYSAVNFGYSKSNSWFNDTRVTNIGYNYSYSDDNDGSAQAVNTNWQRLNKSKEVTLTQQLKEEQIVPNHNINGYGIKYRYNEIPGYYLNYIIIETVDFGVLYLRIDDLFNGYEITTTDDKGLISSVRYDQISASGSKKRLYYKVVHVVPDTDYSGSLTECYYYDIYFYQEANVDADGNNNNVSNMNSIALISNNISVSFFSQAYTGEITYYTNVDNANISSRNEITVSEGEEHKQEFKYDSTTVIDYSLNMTGYTFVGWGSEEADGENRFNADNITWSSASSWQPIAGGIYRNSGQPYSTNNLFSERQNLFLSLRQFTSVGYEFYVKSQNSARTSTTGYFITDTGYANGINQENYNFWSAHADKFKESFGDKAKGSKYDVDLYAVWKANVYAVELNFNDEHDAQNGSTSAHLSEGIVDITNKDLDTYVWNNTTVKVENTPYINSFIRPDNMKYSIQSNNYHKLAEDERESIYYCYVTFDKNDWYMLRHEDVNELLKSDKYSLYLNPREVGYTPNGTTSENRYGTMSLLYKDANNQLEYVIDRYGYSWLGWFSEKLADTYERKSKYDADLDSSKSHIVFGSDYYYSKTSDVSELNKRSMPHLRHPSVAGESMSTPYVTLDQFTGASDEYCVDNYSEFVYRGEEYYRKADKAYVYHYDYMQSYDASVFTAGDYLNYIDNGSTANATVTAFRKVVGYGKLEADNTVLVYFDTSLTLDCFYTYNSSGNSTEELNLSGGYVVISRYLAGTKLDGQDVQPIQKTNYRFITLYAYWSTNLYNVNIDYRDDEIQNSDEFVSLDPIGSTTVTNKSDIENATYAHASDNLTGDENKSINQAYFDDSYFDYIMRMSIPTRVGYDFIGWSFFYRDNNVNYESANEADKTIMDGDLFKYNGFAQPSIRRANNGDPYGYYTLDFSTVVNQYNYNNKGIVVLYNGNDWFSSAYNQFEKLGENYEVYGDAEVLPSKKTDNYDHHHIYIFALWRAQTFTINTNLNIDQEELINGYDQDSAYSIGFYESYDNAGNQKGYTGINSLFLRQKPNQTSISNFDNVFAEVATTITFVLTFDESFENAMFIDVNTEANTDKVERYYYLKDLFAVSSGYYLINWLYRADDPTSSLIANSLETAFGYEGELINKKEDGSQTLNRKIGSATNTDPDCLIFNETAYKKLYNSNYKNMTDHAVGSGEFLKNNHKKLSEIDNSGASSGFGYITISGDKYYIQTEYSDTGNDYKTDKHKLYFVYNGTKYYAVFYANKEGDVSNFALENDFNYLYYREGSNNTDRRYIVRFDNNGQAYYVVNSSLNPTYKFNGSYNSRVNLNIKLAVFASSDSTFDNNGLDLRRDAPNSNADVIAIKSSTFKCLTTRQFSVYAHWKLKTAENNDFVVEMVNDNNAYELDAGDAKINSDIKNPGLAGYYNVERTGTATDVLITQDVYDAGGGNELLGEDIPSIKMPYTYYDDISFDLAPFFNGRFLSELFIDFERFEDLSGAGGQYVSTNYRLIKYRLKFNFTWNNKEKYINDPVIELLKDDNGDGVFEKILTIPQPFTKHRNDGQSLTNFKLDANGLAYNDLLTYLSVIDNTGLSAEDEFGLFSRYDYGEYYDRRDINMLRFEMDDLQSSITVSCKYSIQTYQLNVHHLFDDNGNTLIQSATDRSSYVSQYTTLDEDAEVYDVEDSLDSRLAKDDTTSTGLNQALATIPDNLRSSTFNVPYGYFLYGAYYDSALVGFRPMDDYFGTPSAEYKGSRSHKYDGNTYLYSDGNYAKGNMFGYSDLLLDGETNDLYADQGSPLLGSTVIFPTKSIRQNKSFYLFKGWFENSNTKQNGYIVFDEYDKTDEATYVDRNITLYGYYYANNTPTNIQFYTWNNDWDSSNPAYLPYTNNEEEYTLSSLEDGSPYKVDNGFLIHNADAESHVDEEGRAILKYQVEFGVDSSKFSQDRFSSYELQKTDIVILNNILKNYWYYKETYTVMYAPNFNGQDKVYINYDPEIRTVYQYVPERKIIVNRDQYEAYMLDGQTTYEILADVSTEMDAVTIKRTGQTVQLLYSDEYNKSYFYDPALEYYYYFDVANKNSVMAKTINQKDAFYYYDNGQKCKVKIVSSSDMSNTSMKLWLEDHQAYTGEEYVLSQEKLYTYDFLGSELYAAVGSGDGARYYKYHRVAESEYNSALEGSFIKVNRPRYYVEIENERYYTFVQKTDNYSQYDFEKLYKVSGSGANEEVTEFDNSYDITTLNNYFVELGGKYYQINYSQRRDLSGRGSVYVNPMVYENTVSLTYNNVTKTYYFDYENNSRTSGLYEVYNKDATPKFAAAVLFSYGIYTPINQNYSLNAVLKNNYWESSDITLNAFPSLNMDYWYDNPDYVLLGYLNVSDMDIETMKRSDESEAVFSNSEYEYVPDLKQIVNTQEYETFLTSGSGSYTVFATVYPIEGRIVYEANGKEASLLQDTSTSEPDDYYFYDESTTLYYYFNTDQKNVVRIKYEEGGQIYSAFESYIDDRYQGSSYATMREKLKVAIAGKILQFSLKDLLKSPLYVESYQLSTIDHKTIERLNMRITCQFIFDQAEIVHYGLTEYCDPAYGLAKEISEGKYEISISTSYIYSFSLISTKTQISRNIYAIPVYTPDVIKFVEHEGTQVGSVAINGLNVVIDYQNMNVSHLDLDSARLYNGVYVYDLPTLPGSATAGEIAEREELLRVADYLQFVMLTKTQYQKIMTSSSIDVELQNIIINEGVEVFSQEDFTKDNQTVTFDLTGKANGDYYIFAFYYLIDTTQDANKHIDRVSDNIVHIELLDGYVDYLIEKNNKS